MSEVKISLAAARVNARKTQEDVAKHLHVTKQTIVNWENGKIIPKPAYLNMMCEFYNFPVDNIFLPKELT